MTSITHALSDIVGEAFAACGLPAELGVVRVSDRPDLAQFQCSGAMSAAKQAKKNPRAVAEEIVAHLKTRTEFGTVEIAGPGFINLNVTDGFLSRFLAGTAQDKRLNAEDLGGGKTAILDYGGANVAKAMHVGHLRPAVIGDAVYRTMKFVGYKTIGDVHLGDWGTNMGMLVDDYIITHEQDLVLKADLTQTDTVRRLMDDMAERYPRSATAAKADPERMKRALAATVKIQNKDNPHYSIWQRVRDISIVGLKDTYGALGVRFDLWKGEADVHDYIAPMVDDMRAKGFAVESDGAWIVPVAGDDDKKEMPPLILYKRDGAVMYGTTDMATIVERVKLYDPAKIVYVVDQRQALHFEQVFRAARKCGIVANDVELTHAGFGTLNGPDGKPFKTRDGGVMRLEEFIGMTVDKARQRLGEANLAGDMPADEYDDVARKVAISAIKFADLQNQRQADYIFDLDRLTSFEGKTGPYLLYQTVRIKSLLRKADDPVLQSSSPLIIQDTDRPLALLLTEFPDTVAAAARQYAPHYLCDYAFRLAQQFSSFYAACHILSEPDAALKASRLALCALTLRTLETTLSLLGIEVPERM